MPCTCSYGYDYLNSLPSGTLLDCCRGSGDCEIAGTWSGVLYTLKPPYNCPNDCFAGDYNFGTGTKWIGKLSLPSGDEIQCVFELGSNVTSRSCVPSAGTWMRITRAWITTNQERTTCCAASQSQNEVYLSNWRNASCVENQPPC